MNKGIFQVGDGANFGYGGDTYPYTVIAVSKSGRTITLQADAYRYTNPEGVYTERQTFTFTRSKYGRQLVATLRKDGHYRIVGDDLSDPRIHPGRRAY